jgi:hypothetical protein
LVRGFGFSVFDFGAPTSNLRYVTTKWFGLSSTTSGSLRSTATTDAVAVEQDDD